MNHFAPLHQHCILRTREKVDSHDLIAHELADHFLRWHGTTIDTRLCKLDTPRLSLYSLRYGSEVSIFPDVYDDFSLIHFSLQGRIAVEADRHSLNVRPGNVLVSTPSRQISLRWSHDSEQLILRLPHQLSRETADKMGQPWLHQAVVRTPGLLLSEDVGALWQTQLSAFVALDKAKTRVPGLAPWLAHVEEGIAKFLLLQFASSSTTASASVGTGEGCDRVRQRLNRLLDFVHANLDKPVSLAAMANAVALSERQLNALCHAQLGQSPLTWVRGLRLDAIRKTLLSDPHAVLSDLAMRYGFFHLSRFAAYYRGRFGELPSQTRKSAISG